MHESSGFCKPSEMLCLRGEYSSFVLIETHKNDAIIYKPVQKLKATNNAMV